MLAAGLLHPIWRAMLRDWREEPYRESREDGLLDDASRMEATPVAEIWSVSPDPDSALEEIRQLLARAARDRIVISIAGSRHTMGGHTLYPGGIVLDMRSFRQLELDEKRRILRVGAGARWAEIIPFLDERGLSIAIMQSNNSFTVGGSLSVNAHGWQHARAPIASSVESLRMLMANGSVVRASRTENRDLFRLVLGGYGLFGIILEAELRVIPNQRYRLERRIVASDRFSSTFFEMIRQSPGAGMAYGRLRVDPDHFLEEAMIYVFYPDPASDGSLPPLANQKSTRLKRLVFRGSVGSAYGKELRWNAERGLSEHVGSARFSRNQLLHEPVEVYQDRSNRTTDILHEYFLPVDALEAFLEKMRTLRSQHDVDLLNVTVRHLLEDFDTVLRYADQEMFSLVLLFTQERTRPAEEAMARYTREMIEAALSLGGRYYLAYRPHATRDQFHRAYPRARAFFEAKKRYDPDLRFQNKFFLRYEGVPTRNR